MTIFASFLRAVFPASHTMCGSMVDIQSPPLISVEKKDRKKDRRKKTEETTGQKYNGLPYYTGRP